MKNSKIPPGIIDVTEIFRTNDKFEYQMGFIPQYNRASTEEQIRFCHIIIEKCAGRTTKEALSVSAEDMSFSLKYLDDKLRAARPGSSGHLKILKMIIEFKCLYILKKHC